VDWLRDALPFGGYLLMYEGVNTDRAQDEALGRYNESGAAPYRVRRAPAGHPVLRRPGTRDPGMLSIHQWRPGPVQPTPLPCPHQAGRQEAVNRGGTGSRPGHAFSMLDRLLQPVVRKIIQGQFGGQNAARGSFSWLVFAGRSHRGGRPACVLKRWADA
jgi:hypothetical protein